MKKFLILFVLFAGYCLSAQQAVSLPDSIMLESGNVKVRLDAKKRWNILYGATRSGKTKVSFFLVPLRIAEHYDGNILFAGKT